MAASVAESNGFSVEEKKGIAVDQELSGGCEGDEGGVATKLTTAWYSHAPAALAYTHV